MRERIALGVGRRRARASRCTMLDALEARADVAQIAELLRDAFDMLSEDFEEEQFFVEIRRALLGRAEPDRPRRRLAELLDSETGVLSERWTTASRASTSTPAMKPCAASRRWRAATYTPGVLSGVGSFGGLFALDGTMPDPVLVASADGVGTKLKVAFMTGVHDTIGADLVNHCVNDILVQGARPLFFLDYLATGRLSPDVAEQIVRGMARACRENGCALLGGETAEMPGFYADGEYDVAGFIVGARVARAASSTGTRSSRRRADRAAVVRAAHQRLLAGAARSRSTCSASPSTATSPSSARRSATALLRPHRSYLPVDRAAARRRLDQGHGAHHRRRHHREPAAHAARRPSASHSTARAGRCRRCSPGCSAAGGIDDAEMFRAFNMGVGLFSSPIRRDAERLVERLRERSASRPGGSARSTGRRSRSTGPAAPVADR